MKWHVRRLHYSRLHCSIAMGTRGAVPIKDMFVISYLKDEEDEER